MRRYKIVACILLILCVFGFVLAAPIPVQQLGEVCADAVDGGDNVTIGLGKRVDLHLIEDDDPLLAQSQQKPSSSSDRQLIPWQHQGSSSAPNYASGTHLNPSFSSEGGDKSIQPGTSTEIQPASPSKAKSVSWDRWREVQSPLGEITKEELPPEIKPPALPPGPEGYQPNQPASSSEAKSVSWAPMKKVQLPSSQIYGQRLPPEVEPVPLPLPPGSEGYQANQLASPYEAKSVSWAPMKKVQLPSGQIYRESLLPEVEPIPLPLPPGSEGYQANQPASSSEAKSVSWAPMKKVQLPSGQIHRESLLPEVEPIPLPPGPDASGYQPKIAAQQSPSPPEPLSKNTLSKLVGKLKLKFWRRISGTASGVVIEG